MTQHVMQPITNFMHKAHHQGSGQANDERRQERMWLLEMRLFFGTHLHLKLIWIQYKQEWPGKKDAPANEKPQTEPLARGYLLEPISKMWVRVQGPAKNKRDFTS